MNLCKKSIVSPMAGFCGVRAVLRRVSRLVEQVSSVSLVFFCCVSGADAADWRSLVQPIGTENQPFLLDPAELNASYPPGQGPWDTGTSVTSINTTVPQFFVRFYNPAAPSNPSNQEGRWVMRASTIRGLTPEQIRDRFALPNIPTMMTLGVSTPGESFYTGIAGPIAGWGSGGGQQSQSTTGPYTTFFNGQAVMGYVLSYFDMATTPNGRSIGAYLGAHVPEPYSDMESVFNSLDVLYNPAVQVLFDAALDTITPVRYDNLATSGFRAVALQNHAVDARLDRQLLNRSNTGIWSAGVSSFQNYSAAGFNGDVRGLIVGGDKIISERTVTGLSFAWMHGAIDWSDDGGRAAADYYRAAAYTSAMIDNVFLQATLGIGSIDGHISRNIHIASFYVPSAHGPADSPMSAVSRTAGAIYSGYTADVLLRGGVGLQAGQWRILPVAAVGYIYQSRDGFRETGAGSLNLDVAASAARMAHSQVNLRVERAFQVTESGTITPYVMVGWRYEQRLDGREVTASLNGWSDSFTVVSPSAGSHSLIESVGFEMAAGNRLAVRAGCFNEGQGGYRDYGCSAGISWKL